ECPAEAIVPEDDIPAGQEAFLELNAELSREWPVISEMKAHPEDAKEWDGVPDKLKYLERGRASAAPIADGHRRSTGAGA
ncbi:DUF3470 domain-containing protein, partial [Klebsiella pneumoniae]|uniref:DUF3470 domain-containing protein n=1 Tax=Klebsiella pneumoniae TaxID=573 RepID=UPI002730511F